jgi:hypothetical protein
LFAEQNLRRQLLTSDFTKPVRGTRRAALDDLFRRRILIPGIVGTRLFNRSGTITYAARHQLIGTRVPYLADVGGVFAWGAEAPSDSDRQLARAEERKSPPVLDPGSASRVDEADRRARARSGLSRGRRDRRRG